MSPRPYQSRQIICEVCGRQCKAEQKNRDICRTCLLREPSTRCTRCGLMKHRVSEETGLCPRCTQMVARPAAICARCSRPRAISNKEKQFCQACSREERNGRRICSGCHRLKVIYVKTSCLCKQCYKNHLAPKGLRKYVMNFATPYPYNKVLFDLLATTINWETVIQKTDQKFRAFGRFLQTQQLLEPFKPRQRMLEKFGQ